MELFPQIDKQATIDKVRQFFWDDDRFEGICLRAGNYGLRSPQLDITGIRGSSSFNSTAGRHCRLLTCGLCRSRGHSKLSVFVQNHFERTFFTGL